MKNLYLKLTCISVMVLVAGTACAPENDGHKPITRDLIQLLEEKPDLKAMLKSSLAEARQANPDQATNPAQNLKDYYDFIDSAVDLIPQEDLENPKNLTRDVILQSICYFYFLVDQPLPELENKGLYRNALQYYKPFSTWMRGFANAWGLFLDTEESWNQKTYQEFRDDPRFGLTKGWYESPSNWNTFNRFFSRYLKSPEERPIASPEDTSIVVSPADSVPQGAWPIDGESRITVAGGLKVKVARFYSVEDLLGKDSQYKDAFANGVLTHTFLNVFDYHRYHFAVGGTVKETGKLARNVSVEVSWSEDLGRYVPVDSTGWQFSQTLGYAILDTDKYGLVALIPMGMGQVSSVNFEENVKPGSVHRKGDMLGTFLFGGSDFVILFQDQAGFEITVPETGHPQSEKHGGGAPDATTYKHLLMGESYGVLRGAPSPTKTGG